MKILKLEFRNINSLKGYHEIDFRSTPFTGNSLFAITGPTGSGKSTILDVISLALFNKVPRLDKVTKAEIIKTGAIITRNQQEAMAAVTYEGRGGSYRSEWNISTARTGSLREYNMEVSNAETGELFDLKKSEVPEKNEELIGLNYNQFIKSVLLAQGEFAQFLRAKKDERGELLEKITGTGIYRQLGRMAWEKHKEVYSGILQQQQAIALIRPKLLEAERKKEISASLNEKGSLCGPLEEAIEILKKQLEQKEKVRRSKTEINKLEGEKQKAEEALELFDEENGQPLQQHEKLRAYADDLRKWSRMQEEKMELEKELGFRETEEQKNLLELQRCLKDTGEFTKTEITAENLIEKLGEFREKVSSLQEKRRQKLEVHGNLKSKLEAVLAEIPFPWQEEPEVRLQVLEEIHLASQEKLVEFGKNLQIDLGSIPEEKKELRQRLEGSRKAQMEWVQLEQLSTEILRLRSEESGIQVQKKELPEKKARLQAKVETAGKDLEILQLKRENSLLIANFEDLRRKLRAGEPCQLCGALEHPYAVNLPHMEDSLDLEIRSASGQLQEANHELSAVTTILEGLETRLVEIRASLLENEGSLKVRQKDFKELYGHLVSEKEETWEETCHSLENLLLELEACEKEQRLQKATTVGIPLHRQLNEIFREGRSLKQQLDSLYMGADLHNDCQKLQNDWFRFSQLQDNLRKQQQELKGKIQLKKSALITVEVQLQPLLELGFRSLTAAKEDLLPEQQYQQLSSRREQLRNRLTVQVTSLEVLQTQLQELLQGDARESVEELQEDLRTRSLQLATIKEDCEELRRILRNDHEHIVELNNLKASIEEQERAIRRWRLLNELIGDATGKKFNDFAQDLSLSQLIFLANIRLKDLSDRYRIDKPGDEEDDGLVAIDEHMGGQRRSVKTLSGGETFLLSLSMALALSDLASQNIEINSLFIDEGFGTLDPETLDQTLDTLEKLQAESSKTIGIISHVDSLKERIATQVQLKRNGQGYSQLAVTG